VDVEDVIDLLTIVSVGDKRTVGEADVVHWQKLIGQLDKDECADAIMAHRAEKPGVWLEPGHIFVRVKAKQRDRLERMDPDQRARSVAALEGGHTGVRRDEFGYVDKSAPAGLAPLSSLQAVASEGTRRAFFEEFARLRQVKPDDGVVEDIPAVNPLLVRCPFCAAPVRSRCTMPGMPGKTRETRDTPHPSRLEAAAVTAGFSEEAAEQIAAAYQRRQTARVRSAWSDQDRALTPITSRPAAPAQEVQV
jgi:hypothetical protein